MLKKNADFDWRVIYLTNIERNGYQEEKVWVQKKKYSKLVVCIPTTSKKKMHGDGTLILYLHETWANANLKFMNCWQSNEGVGITLMNASKSLTDVHLGRSHGFCSKALC